MTTLRDIPIYVGEIPEATPRIVGSLNVLIEKNHDFPNGYPEGYVRDGVNDRHLGEDYIKFVRFTQGSGLAQDEPLSDSINRTAVRILRDHPNAVISVEFSLYEGGTRSKINYHVHFQGDIQ